MGSNPDKELIKIFCLQHKVPSLVSRTSAQFVCEGEPHTIGAGFPTQSFWEYCCICERFTPSEWVKTNKISQLCASCDREVSVRYSCDQCKIITVTSPEQHTGRLYTLSAGSSPRPYCPGCLSQPKSALREHQCALLHTSFTTPRAECPFCLEPIKEAVAEVVSRPAPVRYSPSFDPSLYLVEIPEVRSDKGPDRSEMQPPQSASAAPQSRRSIKRASAPRNAPVVTDYRMRIAITALILVIGSLVYWMVRHSNSYSISSRSPIVPRRKLESPDEVTSVAFSTDSNLLASAGTAGKVVIWDAGTGELKQTLQGHSQAVTSVAFSPDGKFLATGSKDNTVRLWDLQSGKSKDPMTRHDGEVSSVAFSPDKKLLASAANFNVNLWDAQTGAWKQTLRYTGRVNSLAFSPDGKTLASGGKDKKVALYDVQKGKERDPLVRHSDEIDSVAFSPDGKLLASAGSDFNVFVWDAQTGDLKKSLKHTSPVRSITFSSDSKMLISASDDNAVDLWEVQSGTLTRRLEEHSGWVQAVAVSPDGKTIASGGRDKAVILWGASTGTSHTARNNELSQRPYQPEERLLVALLRRVQNNIFVRR